jgi:glycosyltransferase involved in cell wall biosynthesis
VATGRLAKQKNYPALLRSAVHLPDVEFHIVGDGPEREALFAMAHQLGVENRVRFLGHMRREEALAVLADADIFAQPSLFEGHSLALIEAAQAGLPLVVSNVPVQIEGITARDGTLCGVSVPPEDDVGLAQAIKGLFEDQASFSKLSGKAIQLGRENTFSAMTAQYEKLLT